LQPRQALSAARSDFESCGGPPFPFAPRFEEMPPVLQPGESGGRAPAEIDSFHRVVDVVDRQEFLLRGRSASHQQDQSGCERGSSSHGAPHPEVVVREDGKCGSSLSWSDWSSAGPEFAGVRRLLIAPAAHCAGLLMSRSKILDRSSEEVNLISIAPPLPLNFIFTGAPSLRLSFCSANETLADLRERSGSRARLVPSVFFPSRSISRTESPRSTIWMAMVFCLSIGLIARSARACPIESLSSSTSFWTSAGSLSSRRELVMLDLSFPTLRATSSWVIPSSSTRRLNALASSMAFSSWRWMFSISDTSSTFSSRMALTTHGTCFRPARCAALQRRSPATISNLSPFRRTTSG